MEPLSVKNLSNLLGCTLVAALTRLKCVFVVKGLGVGILYVGLWVLGLGFRARQETRVPVLKNCRATPLPGISNTSLD